MIEFMLEMTCVGSLILAVIIFASNTRRIENQLFAALAAIMGLWSLSILLFESTTLPGYALEYSRIYYILSVMFAPLLAVVTWYYPRGARLARPIERGIIAGVIVFAAAFIFDKHLLVSSFSLEPKGWTAVVNVPMYLMFSCYFIAYFIAAYVIGFRKIMRFHGTERSRMSFYLYGMLATSLPGYVTDLFLPLMGDYSLVWVGPISSSFFLLATGYSIARHGLLDVKLFLGKAALYILTITILAGIYAGVIYLTIQVLLGGHLNSTAAFAMNVTAAVIVAFSLDPIRTKLDKLMTRLFRYKRYDAEALIDTVSSISVRQTDLAVLLDQVADRLDEAFKPRFMAIVFRDTTHRDVVRGRLAARLLDYGRIESAYQAQGGEWTAHSKEKILPLATSAQELGYLVIGTDREGRPFQLEDERTLGVIAAELSVAIQNIFRLEEIRAFARTLEHDVNDATKELRASNNKLMEMDATKDEFVSMASHQLRTPLTSVKGYISMVLEGDAGEITEAQRQLLAEAYASSERMVHLIADFLNVSRLQTGKFVIDRQQVDLALVAHEEVDSIRHLARSHDISIDCKIAKRLPLLYVDEGKIRQVIMNFIDNAIYYSPESKRITVSLRVEDGDVVLRVIDRGIGVPPDVQKKLFTKFFRAENARRQRPDGTGVGLFLAKKVIDGHQGKLVFESELGKGSTFGFRLPIKRLSLPPAADTTTPVGQ